MSGGQHLIRSILNGSCGHTAIGISSMCRHFVRKRRSRISPVASTFRKGWSPSCGSFSAQAQPVRSRRTLIARPSYLLRNFHGTGAPMSTCSSTTLMWPSDGTSPERDALASDGPRNAVEKEGEWRANARALSAPAEVFRSRQAQGRHERQRRGPGEISVDRRTVVAGRRAPYTHGRHDVVRERNPITDE